MIKKFMFLAAGCSFFVALNSADVVIEKDVTSIDYSVVSPAEFAVDEALNNLEFKTGIEVSDDDIDVLIDENVSWKDRLNILYKYVKMRSLDSWEKYEDKYIIGGLVVGSFVSIIAIILIYKKYVS